MTILADTHTSSPAPPSQVFLFRGGFVFASDGVVTTPTERFTAMLLIAAGDKEFDVGICGHTHRQGAAVIKPFVTRSLDANRVPFVSLGISPTHPRYRKFSMLPEPGCLALPRTLFVNQQAGLQRLLRRELDLAQAIRLFNECVDAAAASLPQPKPLDPRIARVIEWLNTDPAQGMEALAERACVSYYRLSHLFTQEMGVSLRQYQSSFKVIVAVRMLGEGMSLTDAAHAAGFSDSAHLSRVWTKAFGAPPSYFLHNDAVSVHPKPRQGASVATLHHPGVRAARPDFADSIL